MVYNNTNTTYFNGVSFHMVVAFDILVIVAAFLLNILGICLLIKRKLKNLTTQNILIIHLSFVSIVNICTNTTALYWKFHNTNFTEAFIAVYYFAHMGYVINLSLLVFDRFLCIAFPFYYKRKMTKFITFIEFGFLWLFSSAFGFLIHYSYLKNFISTYGSYVYNGFLCVFYLCVYIFIIIKMYCSTTSVGRELHSKKLFLIPTLIVFSFFLFVFLPHVIAYNVKLKSKNSKHLLLLGLIGINMVNNVSDPIIYIYLQKNARQQLASFIKWLKAAFCNMRVFAITTSCFYVNHKVKFKLYSPLDDNSSQESFHPSASLLSESSENVVI